MKALVRQASMIATCLGLAACATTVPPRYVVEHDLGNWAYRRYQKTMDVEFPVQDDPAVGHTAAYVLHGHQGERARVRVATAFITVYEKAHGLAAEVKERLDTLTSYSIDVDRVDGQWVWRLDGGRDHWLLWVSGNRLVKLGSPDGTVPDALAKAYLHLYSSDLDPYGRAREGTPSYGKSHRELEDTEDQQAPPIPSNLREGAPR